MTGQAVGIGGDRLSVYSHPAEIAHAYQDAGWTAEQIARSWDAAFGAYQQGYGVELPPLELGATSAR